MNIFHKITLQSMKRSRSRTIVTVVGVILSAALTTAVAAFGTSLLHFLVNSSIEKYGGWHAAFLDVDASFAEARSHDCEAVSAAAFENIGYAVLDGAKSPEKPYAFIAGFNEEAFEALPVRLIIGRLPENSGEILVPAHVAVKAGIRYRVGDTLTFPVGSRMAGDRELGQENPYLSGAQGNGEVLKPKTERTYTVVGICERPGFEGHTAPGYTMITRAGQGEEGARFSVFVTLKNPRGVKEYAERTAGGSSYILNEDVLRFMGVSENRLFNALLYTVGSILAAIIMVGSVFLIYNSFNISMNERIRQFGILASVGATSKQLRHSVLFEGICIGALGIPLGILAGIGSVALLIPVVAGQVAGILHSGTQLTLWVSGSAIAGAAALSLLTILISAYIPARKAANTPVMESIRQTNEVKTEASAVRTSRLALRIYGLEGTLALKNFKRNKKRYRSIVLSLVLSVVLFVSGNAFGSTLKRISQQYMVDMDYDIVFSAGDMKDEELFPLYDKLKNTAGVYDSTYQSVLAYSTVVEAGELSARYREYSGVRETVRLPMDMQFIEDSKYLDFIGQLGLPEEEYTGGDAKMIAVAKQRVEAEDGSSEIFDIFAGKSMALYAAPVADDKPMTEQGQSIMLTFTDTYPVDPPPSASSESEPDHGVFMVVAPYSLKEKFATPGACELAGLGFMSHNPSQSVPEMETVIQSEGITSEYILYNMNEILNQFNSMAFVINVFTYVFVVMISLIAVANVFNTISTNIRLRRRELAMLRSVGMADKAFNRMMHFECIFYGARTLLFGLPIAGAASWLIFKGLVSVERLDNLDFVFPWGSMAVSVFSVLFIVFITMVYSVGKIRKENIIDALRDDMT